MPLRSLLVTFVFASGLDCEVGSTCGDRTASLLPMELMTELRNWDVKSASECRAGAVWDRCDSHSSWWCLADPLLSAICDVPGQREESYFVEILTGHGR